MQPRLRRRPDPLTLEVTRRIRRSFVVAASPLTAYFTLARTGSNGAWGGARLADGLRRLLVAGGSRRPGRADGGAARAFRRGGQGDRSVFADKAREGIAYAFIAGLPPLFLLAVFASPIADILANGQLRVGDLIQALAGCLVVLAVAQLQLGCMRSAAKPCLPGSMSEVPASPPCWRSASRWPGSVDAARARRDRSTDRVERFAVLAGDVVAASTVILLLRRVVRPHGLADRRRLRAAAMASTVMLTPVAGGWLLVDLLHANRIGNLLIIGMTSMLALALFGLTLHAATRHPGVPA